MSAQVWMTSDWHFGHRNILTLGEGRPFTTIEEHDAALIERHNALVAPKDTVWALGDAAMGDIATSLFCCSRMNGRKILVCGNHDRPSMVRPNRMPHWMGRYIYEGGFTDIITERNTFVELAGQRVVVSHYPYAGESEPDREDRYAERRPVDVGMWLLHGHVHDAWRVNGRQINVGVDVWGYAPVNAEILSGMIGNDGWVPLEIAGGPR